MKFKIKIIFLTFITSTVYLGPIYAQVKSFKIKGYIDTSYNKRFITKELILTTYSNYSRNIQEASIIKIPVNVTRKGANYFESKVTLSDSLQYFSIELERNPEYNDGKTGIRVNINTSGNQPPFDQAYLFEQGDSIDMQIKQNGIILFKGKGSEKLNCQSMIYDIDELSRTIKRRGSELFELNRLEAKIALYEKSVNNAIDLKLEILNSFKNNFSQDVFDLIYLDVLSVSKFAIYQGLGDEKWKITNNKNLELRKKNLDVLNNYYKNLDRSFIKVNDSHLLSSSAYYADMKFQDEYNNFILENNNKMVDDRGSSFKEMYDLISIKYSGKLRDKLLFICFRRLHRFHSDETKLYIDEAINLIEDNKFKDLLKSWKEKISTTYPFEFYDVNDQVHSLEKYRGKLLVIDFWYNGCIHCTHLASAMHEIVASYKNTKDVVFLTVNLDRKDVWLKGLKTGLYTSPGTIDLYTNGLRYEHPLVKYYNFRSFPQQLIIGKQGEMISTSPPRVDIKTNRDIFVKILNDELVKK